MKNSRLAIFLAGMNLAATIGKMFASIDGGWLIPQGWVASLIIDILSVYILATFKIRYKWTYVLLGGIAIVAIVCLLATLSLFDIVYLE